MKKKITIIAVCIVLLVAGIGIYFGGIKQEKAQLIVATDTHFLSSAINDNGEAFQRMLVNSDGKLVQYDEEIFDAFSAEVIERKPDALILSGDISFNGEKASHMDFAKKLKTIEDNGVPVLVIPGNHDINSNQAASYFGNEIEKVETVSAEEFGDIYKDFGLSEAISADENSLSYLSKINKDLYILMLDTNAYGQNFIQDSSYPWIEQQLKYIKKKGAKVITVTHQNVFAQNEYLSFGYQLYDGDELLELLNKYKVKCNLSGHIHMQHHKNDGLTEIVTSSLLVSPCQYGIVDFDGKIHYEAKTVDVEKWAKDNSITDENLLNFSTFSTDFFANESAKMAARRLEDKDLSDQERVDAINAFSALNSYNFAGRATDIAQYENGINAWENADSFMFNYIKSMAEDIQKDYTKITIK